MSWFVIAVSSTPAWLHNGFLLGPQGPSPSPTPKLDETAAQSTPMVLWLVLGLMTAAVLLGLSMRGHLRKIPVDLDVATRKGSAKDPSSDTDE